MNARLKRSLAILLPMLLLSAGPAAGGDAPVVEKAAISAPVNGDAEKSPGTGPKTEATPNAHPARDYFGRQRAPSAPPGRAIGGYSRGCLAGAQMLPTDGASWQVMRLSRNRNWGHPDLIRFITRLAAEAPALGWRGMLVGDMAQPMGGPMSSGHASHQIGLDVDFWLNPMPPRTYSAREREDVSAVSMLTADGQTVDPNIWTDAHASLLKRAASHPETARIFVHPAIKKTLCDHAGSDRAWLHKVQPWWGHHYHFHVRLLCPNDNPDCENQKPRDEDDGCGAELDRWLKLIRTPPKPDPKPAPAKPKPPLTLGELPRGCVQLLQQAGAFDPGKTAGAVPAPKP